MYDSNIFQAKSLNEREAIVKYFLGRSLPKVLPQNLFAGLDWGLGNPDQAIAISDRMDKGKFLAGNGKIIPFAWRNPAEWHDSGVLRYMYVFRGNLLGDLCLAYQMTGNKKYLRLFSEFFDMFNKQVPLKVKPFDLTKGDASFYDGFDPNMPWIKNDWGRGQNPMDTGHRILRYWRIWDTGIFAKLPFASGFRFLKAQFEDLMAYKIFSNFPYKAGNHYLFEVGTVPFMASAMFPEWEECRIMNQKAGEVINNYIRCSILPDGAYLEHSCGYALSTWRDLMAPYCFAIYNNMQLLTKNNVKKLIKFSQFILDLSHPNKELVRFGDTGAFRWISETGSFLNKYGFPAEPSRRPVNYPCGGYTFLGGTSDHMAISALNKHNPKGHVHWENLNFELCYDGIVWIGDPAAVLRERDPYTRPLIYSGKARKALARQYHYSFAAHNTVLIDDMVPGNEPYVEHEFGGIPPKCREHRFASAPQMFSASHWAYLSLGIKHKRKFMRLSKTAYLVKDTFTGHPDSREHTYKTMIHPMPDISINVKGQMVILEHKSRYVTLCFGKGELMLVPDNHVRKHAYTAVEKKLNYIVHRTRAKGPHCSSFLILLGRRKASAAMLGML